MNDSFDLDPGVKQKPFHEPDAVENPAAVLGDLKNSQLDLVFGPLGGPKFGERAAPRNDELQGFLSFPLK